MTQILESVDQAIHILDSNDFLFVPTETSYLLTHRQRDAIASYRNTISKPVFLFPHQASITQFTSNLSWFANLLLQVLPPGAVEFTLPSNGYLQDNIFTAYVPAHEGTQELLERFHSPVVGTYPQLGFNALATSAHQLQEHKEFEDMYVLPSNSSNHRPNGILPTLLDLTQPNQVIIRRPGPISYEEIQSILGGRVQVVKRYEEPKKYYDNMFKLEVAYELGGSTEGTTLVMGSRENLSRFFQIGQTEYFHLKKSGNYILQNLGSVTNPEVIAKNLSKHFLEINKIGVERVVFLNQTWGNHKWAETITHYLRSVLPTRTSLAPAVDPSPIPRFNPGTVAGQAA
jgi:tRNA A37 threonylcarbamoyladenosine synthetase subunit TsaC/SUA5/YrdC